MRSDHRPRSILIRYATVVTGDAGRRVIPDGAVLVEDGRITAVGPAREVAAPGEQVRVIDARGRFVLPGFVNAHAHVGYTIFRGLVEDAGLGCVPRQYFPMATVFTRDERLALGALTCAELLLSGVTTVMEMEEDGDVLAPFAAALGMRAHIAVMLSDVEADGTRRGVYVFDPEVRAAGLRQAADFVERWRGAAEGRIVPFMAVNTTLSSSPEQLREASAAARRLGVDLSLHLGWGAAEGDATRRLHGVGPFEFARDHGWLGPDVIAVHCYHAEAADLDLLSNTRTRVAHCPLINAVRGHTAPLLTLRERGVTVGLGSDNLHVDFFAVTRQALLGARLRAADPVALAAPDAFELATLGGARTLGCAGTLGSLEPGKRADLVVLDGRSPGLVPALDPVATIVHHAHPGNVDLVMVDGRVVVEDRRLLTADFSALAARAEVAAAAAWGRFVAKYGGYAAG